MIDKALKLLEARVQDHLLRQPDLIGATAKPVKLVNVTKDDGTVAIDANTVGMTLINIEEERINKAQSHNSTLKDGRLVVMSAELHLNLYLLFSAHFGDYSAGIAYLSAVIGFFQGHNVFTAENSPGMDPRIERLAVDLYSLNLEQQNHLWGYLGGKYLPSVVYKVRLVRVQEAVVQRDGARITHVDIDGRGVQR